MSRTTPRPQGDGPEREIHASVGGTERLCPQSSPRPTFLAGTEVAIWSWCWPLPDEAGWTAPSLHIACLWYNQVNPHTVEASPLGDRALPPASPVPLPGRPCSLTPALSPLSTAPGGGVLTSSCGLTVLCPLFCSSQHLSVRRTCVHGGGRE